MSNVTVHTLVLKNSLDELTVLSKWVEALTETLHLSPKVSFRLDLVLTEAVTNIIQNAYQDAEGHDIRVTVQQHHGGLKVQLCDDGVPFDPLQVPPPDFPEHLDDAKEGGLGIHLIRSYTDECTYQREGNDNQLTFTICDRD